MNNTQNPSRADVQRRGILITGAGLLTGSGFGVEENWQPQARESAAVGERFSLKSFPVARHLTDRKLMKVVSLADAFGLAAFEQALASASLKKGDVDPWSIGIYVGAQPSRLADNENYNDAVNETRGGDPSSAWNERAFGKTMAGARPTSLLQGLPNNVLCYGAILCDGRGPNSNYTMGETSGLAAVINAVRRLRRGQIEVAVAGGYGAQLDPVQGHIDRQVGYLAAGKELEPFEGKGTLLGDGAAFLVLETDEQAARRGKSSRVRIVGVGMASDGGGPMARRDGDSGDGQGAKAFCSAVVDAIKQCLTDSGLSIDQVGLVSPSACGIRSVDGAELAALEQLWAHSAAKPAIGAGSRDWGNVMEAGGVGEIALLEKMYLEGELPERWRVMPSSANSSGFKTNWAREKPYAVVLRSTPWGEVAAVAVEVAL